MPSSPTRRTRTALLWALVLTPLIGLNAPAFKERLESLGLVPAPSTANELVQLQARESKFSGPLVKTSGFTPED